MRRLIGQARCDTSRDCRTIAVGARACGGPQDYLAWSVRDTNAGQLEAVVARLNEASRARVASSGELSTCEHIADPGASCVQGRCRTGGGARD